MKNFDARVEGKVLKLRFPYSGRVVSVNFSLGDLVKKGAVLSSLDTTILKKRQQKELKDFEKVRMWFDQVKKKGDESLIKRAQADLDSAVLAVEIIDWEVRHNSVVSPSVGKIISDGGVYPGIYVSPASNQIELFVEGSEYVRAEVDQKYVSAVKRGDECKFGGEKGKIVRVLPGKKAGSFFVDGEVKGVVFGRVGKLYF